MHLPFFCYFFIMPLSKPTENVCTFCAVILWQNFFLNCLKCHRAMTVF
ncbi:hypothetical protein CUS_7180 [Ruminococcus albus 8]|uniref:Uncharacterized protein n=1 Tax=Ruminococcus albus 8 TaxID=246199 RepID=E9SDI4_RUMAL|nr:hypothetical protein CUS_7180 [Ruminococcus albus 8]